MRKQQWLSIASVAMAVCFSVLLYGCGSRASDNTSADSNVTVRMWAFPMLPELRDHKLYDELVAGFEKSNPGVKVKVEMLPWAGRAQKMLTAIAGNRAPDAVYLNLDYMPRFVDQGVLEPMDDYISAEEKADYPPEVLDAVTIDGKMWLLPLLRNPNIGIFNSKLLREAGFDPADPPRTWEQVDKAVRAMTRDTDGDGAVDQWGVGFIFGAETVNSTFWPLLWQAGGDVLTTDGKRAAFDGPEGEEALTLVVNWFRDGIIPKSFIAMGASEFAMGRLGYLYGGGPNEATNLLRDAPDIPLTVGPVLEHRARVSYSTIGSYALFKQSKHKKETAAWLRYMTSPEVMARFCKETKYVPTKISVGSIYADDPIFHVFEREAAFCRPDVKSVFARQIMMHLAPEMQAAALGKKSPREALDAAAKAVNEMLDRANK